MRTTVELKTAYHWDCDDCGAENFVLPQRAELTDEEREEAYREIHEMEDWVGLPENWQNFELVEIPDQVTCSTCDSTFATIDERDVDGI